MTNNIEWEEEFKKAWLRIFVAPKEDKYQFGEMRDFIRSLLSSQAEEMERKILTVVTVPEEETVNVMELAIRNKIKDDILSIIRNK